jgi:hypothetical protein
MNELDRQGGTNASRLLSTRNALVILTAACWLLTARADLHAQSLAAELPDAPSALMLSGRVAGPQHTVVVEAQNVTPSVPGNTPQNTVQHPADSSVPVPPAAVPPGAPVAPAAPQIFVEGPQAPSGQAEKLPPCPKHMHPKHLPIIFLPATEPGCEDQLQLIVDTGYETPLSVRQKGVLAIRSVTDPFNLLTIAAFSAVSVAANAHSVYGPGFAGWGRLSGYSLAEDVQGTFTGVYLIPVLLHEDPRYHRMPRATIRRRIEHALIHTFVSQHDDGSLMPNYATLINYPLSAEISNFYVPGIGTNTSSTAKRVLVGYATDPIGPLVGEFLPDVAKRIHIHIIFAQQILNAIALGSGAQPSSY